MFFSVFFIFDLSDLLIGVGFVTGVTFTTHLLNMKFVYFWGVGKPAIRYELLFFINEYLLSNVFVFDMNLIPECAY